MEQQIRYIEGSSSATEEIVEGDDSETMIEYTNEIEEGEAADHESHNEIEEEEEEVVLETLPVQFQKVIY